MRIVIPYAPERMEHVITISRIASKAGQHHVEAWRVLQSDDYWRILRDCWSFGRSFIVCEHDMLPTPEQIRSLAECSRPWCGFVYFDNGGYRQGLGLTKFDARLMRAAPFAIAGIAERGWRYLDGQVFAAMRDAGFGSAPHAHYPPVEHVNGEDRRGVPVPASPVPHRCVLGHECDCFAVDGHGCPIPGHVGVAA